MYRSTILAISVLSMYLLLGCAPSNQDLTKGAAITCEARFASLDKLAELAIIMLKEHWRLQ